MKIYLKINLLSLF